MKKAVVITGVMWFLLLLIPFKGAGVSLAMAQNVPSLTPQEAISAARSNAKPGSSFTVLGEIVANADTRRIGERARGEASARQITLFKNGILADVLTSGGFLLAETEPSTNNVIAIHLVSAGPDGVRNDAFSVCNPPVSLADAQELVKDTAEFAGELYSIPPTEAKSLESRFFDGSFPKCDESEECTLFAIPHSLLKIGADQNEYREVTVLYGSISLFGFQYAVSMSGFAASPLVATQAAAEKVEALEAEFLRKNHMNPDFDLDPKNILSRDELRERIEVLRRLNKFIQETLKKEPNPALLAANISIATIALQVGQGGPFNRDDKALYGCGTASLLVIYWRRLATGAFAVNVISEAD